MSYADIPDGSQTQLILRAIATDEARIDELLIELSAVRNRVTANRFKIAPVRRLPWELLAAVAQFAIEDEGFIFVMASTSKIFRTAMLISPSLWTHLTIYVDRKHAINLSKIYLSRSGALPLHISLPMPPRRGSKGHLKPTKQLMCEVAKHQHRIQSLTFNAESFDTANAAFEQLSGPAPMLRKFELVIDCTYHGSNDVFKPFATAFYPAPELRELRLQHATIPMDVVRHFDFPFTGLTTLSLGHFNTSSSNLKCLFEKLPNLRSLKLVKWEDIQLGTAIILLPTLSELTIVDLIGSGHSLGLLGSLRTPNLRSLSISDMLDTSALAGLTLDDVEIDEAVIELVGRIELIGAAINNFFSLSSKPQLESLRLIDSEMTSKHLLRILRQCDHLKNFTLGGSNLPIALYKALSSRIKATSGHKPFLPHLRELTFVHTEVNINRLAKVIKTRNLIPETSLEPLRILKLEHCYGGPPREREQLATMNPNRLKVVDNGPPPSVPRSESTMPRFFNDLMDHLYTSSGFPIPLFG